MIEPLKNSSQNHFILLDSTLNHVTSAGTASTGSPSNILVDQLIDSAKSGIRILSPNSFPDSSIDRFASPRLELRRSTVATWILWTFKFSYAVVWRFLPSEQVDLMVNQVFFDLLVAVLNVVVGKLATCHDDNLELFSRVSACEEWISAIV